MPLLSYSKRDCRGILLLTIGKKILNIQSPDPFHTYDPFHLVTPFTW